MWYMNASPPAVTGMYMNGNVGDLVSYGYGWYGMSDTA